MAYKDLILAAGPSNYWTLNESAGLTAVDLAGGKNGTLSGGVTLAQPGALADGTTAMAFNGTTGKIDVAGPVTQLVPVSYECWVKPGPTGNCALFESPYTKTPPNVCSVEVNSTNQIRVYLVYAVLADTDMFTPIQASIRDGGWHHVVVVFPGGAVALCYLDGVSLTLSPSPPGAITGSSTEPVTLAAAATFGHFCNGSLDEVAIYPRALTPTEISDHYAARLTTAVPSAGCDHTTVWSKHLATLSAPTVESERAYLANLYGEPGGTDFSTLVSRWLQAITCGTAVATPAAPTLSLVSPSTGTQGTMVTVTLTGTNFVTGATGVSVNGVGISVVNIQVLSPTSLTADLAIDAAAPPTARSITVTTAGGSSSQAFTVAVPVSTLARVQAWTKQTSSVAQVVPFRCTPRPTVGNALIVFINLYRSAPSTQVIASVVDTNSNPYQLAGTAQANGTVLQQIWYCPKLTSTALGSFFDLTITASAGSVFYVVQVVEVTGVGAGLVVDQSVGATGSSAAPATGVTPALTAATVFQAAAHAIAAAQTTITVAVQSPAWTEDVEELPFNVIAGEGDTRLVPSALGTTPSLSWTDTTTGLWAAGLVAFKAS